MSDINERIGKLRGVEPMCRANMAHVAALCDNPVINSCTNETCYFLRYHDYEGDANAALILLNDLGTRWAQVTTVTGKTSGGKHVCLLISDKGKVNQFAGATLMEAICKAWLADAEEQIK